MDTFTPVSATIGGLLIGLAAVGLMAFNGRIAGISGIVSGAVGPGSDGRGWRLAFILGLVLGPLLVLALEGTVPGLSFPAIRFPAETMPGGLPALIIGGLLVGYGTRLGSGCTSGHGVCGLARFSTRSLVATLCFMASGIATVTLWHHFA